MKNTLIAAYTLFILFIVSTAIFASKTFDGDVDNAYEKGMQYPVELKKITSHGWQLSISNHVAQGDGQGEIEVVILDRNNEPVNGADIVLDLSRLTKQGILPSLPMTEQAPGHYSSAVNIPVDGFWQVDTTINYQGENLHHTFKIYIERTNG